MLRFLRPVPGLLIILLSLPVSVSFGQASPTIATLRGTVTDDQDQPLPGVNVVVKGTGTPAATTGTLTDAKGQFSLIPAKPLSPKDALVFSFIGFTNTEAAIGSQRTFTIQLKPTNQTLSEVVVTALGIRREEKTLGYAATTISENVVKDAKSNNWVNTLSGKVAGLNIQGAGAGPMGSSRITLRGESSLNLDNNQALIVVDGVPVSNRITGTGHNSHLSADSPVDYGSSVSDINPDDIEKITVLKGPGATALYGSRAAGGALIITTKSGVRKDRGIGVTINSNISIEQVN
ncbi:MAG: TonB-dependent receptor plug domain-containing protein, partial [Rudanella sp.]|nr:TonB-dependent receptor plug domain-containing protein [Rudanella sp.]